jgi:hypothetical protein
MWFNVERFSALWHRLETENIQEIVRRMPGDQDYITRFLDHNQVRFLPRERVISWRWQAHDGGWDFRTRRPRAPGTGTVLKDGISVLVFHGDPKPHETYDPIIVENWR